MRRIIVSMALVLGIWLPMMLEAATFTAGEQAGTGLQQTIADDVYIAGGTVQSNAAVAGDVIAAGGTVTIVGSTTQDVIAAGGTVDVRGSVGDDVRVAGGTVTVSGNVIDDVILAGGQVTLAEGSTVGGDAVITGGSVNLNGLIQGNVQVSTGQLTIGPTTIITGKLTYNSPNQATIQNGATLSGGVQFNKVERSPQQRFFSFGSALVRLVSLFLIALLLQWLFRHRMNDLVHETRHGVWGNLGRGFIALIITPILAVLLMITIIGIPLGIIVILAYIILLIASYLLLPVLIGAWIMSYYRRNNVSVVDWKSAIVGALVVVVLSIIPFIGGLINFILLLIVFGALIKGILYLTQRERQFST